MAIKKITAPSLAPTIFTNPVIIERIVTSTNDTSINTVDIDVNDIITDGSVTNVKINSMEASKLTGTLGISQLPQTNIASDRFLKGDGTWDTITIPAGVEIVSDTFDGGGNGGANNSTAFFTAGTATIDANKSGVFTFTCTYEAGQSQGGGSSIVFAGMRMQLDGSTTGTVRQEDFITGGNTTNRGMGFGRATFSSSGSSRSLTIQGGSTGSHSSPGGVNLIGAWQVVYS